jgi:hypothetical protein
MAGPPFSENLFGQRRDDVGEERLRALEKRLVTAEADLAAAFPLGVGAWTPYTPTNVNITVGDGTQTARYTRIGDTVHFVYELIWGSSTAFGGAIDIGLPVAAAAALSVTALFSGYAADANGAANSRTLSGFITSVGAATVRPRGDGAHAITGSVPFTWTTSDVLQFGGIYEAAA